MTYEEHSIDSDLQASKTLLSSDNIKAYLLTMFGIASVIVLYYLLLGPAATRSLPDQTPRDGPGAVGLNSWPVWGQLVFPSPLELTIGIAILIVFALVVMYLHRRSESHPSICILVLFGTLLIVGTNLIHGWLIGIEQPIAGATELFTDVLNIDNVLDFISNYEIIQPTLTVHAQTQPPGAVLSVYLFSLFLNNPGIVAIGLCLVSAVGSAFFLHGIINQLFDEESARYATLLYLLLPAVQVYYLANIYALVATLSLGVLYFYFHSDWRIGSVGASICLFLLTFITFLSVYMVLFLIVYEILSSRAEIKTTSVLDILKVTLRSLKRPLLLSLAVGIVYGFLFVTLGFNYVNAFLYASVLENPDGFMLLSNPIQYITTRVQNILDIIIFFGPVLFVLSYRGIVILRETTKEDSNSFAKYNLVLSALIALGLLFLTGAPKKGETARICMFILPFLLIPVITYIQQTNMSRKDKILLLALVFGQAVLLQLFGIWVW